MENFNLRKYLYNNLLTEGQEVEEVSSKLKKSELREKIKAEITNTLSEQDDEDLAADIDGEGDDIPTDDAPDLNGDGEPDFSDEAGLSD